MDISCSSCNGRFKIPDAKLPKSQAFSIPCPKCKKKITINVNLKGAKKTPAAPQKTTEKPAKTAEQQPETKSEKTLIERATAEYNSADKPFDFIEEGVETALVCEADKAINADITEVLEKMGYAVTSPQNPMEALKQMRFHDFHMVLLNERFGTSNPDENHVRKYLDRLAMEFRREIFVVLLTDRFRSSDNMVAFNKSVNLILNSKDLGQIRQILAAAISDHAAFYRIFKESMIATGKV